MCIIHLKISLSASKVSIRECQKVFHGLAGGEKESFRGAFPNHVFPRLPARHPHAHLNVWYPLALDELSIHMQKILT